MCRKVGSHGPVSCPLLAVTGKLMTNMGATFILPLKEVLHLSGAKGWRTFLT